MTNSWTPKRISEEDDGRFEDAMRKERKKIVYERTLDMNLQKRKMLLLCTWILVTRDQGIV